MKLITKIVGATLGLALAVGVGFGVANNNKTAREVNATPGASPMTSVFNSKSFGVSSGDGWDSTTDGYALDASRGIQVSKGNSAVAVSKETYTNITNINVTGGSASKGTGTISVKVGSGTAKSWTLAKGTADTGHDFPFSPAESGKVTLTVSADAGTASIYCKNITITYSGGGTGTILDTPAPSYSDGNVTWEAVDNAISYDLSINGGEAIHNAVSPYSTSSFAVPEGYTVSVTAVGNGTTYLNSNPGSVKFALLNKAGTEVEPYDVANARAAIDGEATVNGVYVTGIVSQVTSFNETYHSITYWISDDGTTTNQFEVYGGLSFDGDDFNSINDIEVGATVVVYGNITKFNSTYEFSTNSELVSYDVRSVFENKQTFSSLTYHYSKTETETFSDELNRALTEVSGTTYTDWDDKTVNSGVVYKGNSAGGNDSIQFRSNNNDSGIVTTTSSKIAKSLTVTWESHTDNARILQVFGKNTAYSAATDLYDDNNKGDLVAELAIANSDANKTLTYEFETTYKYLGFKSKSSAQYVASIEIEWSDMTIDYTSATLRFGAMVNASSWSKLENVVGYGVMISYEDLGVYSIEELYRDAKTNENTIDQAIDDLFDVDGLETDDDGVVEGKSFYQPLSGKAEGHPDSANAAQKTDFGVEGDYYIWYLNKNVAGKLGVEYTAVAYIRTTTDLIFLQDSVASAKSVAAQKL